MLRWQIGPWGRVYLWPWLQANAWLSLSPGHQIWCVHGWYLASELTAWLTQTVYHQSLAVWLWDVGLLALVPAGGFLALLLGWATWPTEAEREGAEHVRGVALLSPQIFQAALTSRRRSWRWRRAAVTHENGIQVAGILLTRLL